MFGVEKASPHKASGSEGGGLGRGGGSGFERAGKSGQGPRMAEVRVCAHFRENRFKARVQDSISG